MVLAIRDNTFDVASCAGSWPIISCKRNRRVSADHSGGYVRDGFSLMLLSVGYATDKAWFETASRLVHVVHEPAANP